MPGPTASVVLYYMESVLSWACVVISCSSSKSAVIRLQHAE